MTTRSPVTAANPRRSAAPLPAFAWRSSVNPSSLLQLVEDLARSVLRPIVDDDQLDAERHGEHAADDFLDRGTLVVHGHDHRKQRIGRECVMAAETYTASTRRMNRAGCSFSRRTGWATP